MKGINYNIFVFFIISALSSKSFTAQDPTKTNSLSESVSLKKINNEAPSSLQESIRSALINNPITNANQKNIEAQELRVKALKQSQLPSFSSSYSVSRNTGDRITTSQNLFMGLNLNIFRGGADVHRQRAMEASVQAQRARINSTDILLPDTNGHLASNVFTAFLSIATSNEAISLSKDGITMLEEIYDFVDNEAQLQIQTQFNNLRDGIRRQENTKTTAINDFIHYVHERPSVNIQNLVELRLSLNIPASAEESVNIGLVRSPTIVALNYDLESSRHSYRADVADSRSPRLDLSVGRNIHQLRTQELHSKSQGNLVALTLSYSWSPADSTYLEATSKNLEATIHRLDSEKLNISHKINSLYESLISTEDFIENFEERATLEREAFDLLTNRLKNGEKINIQTLLDKFGAFMNATDYWIHYTMAAINYRFALQQAIGTLFEDIQTSGIDLENLQRSKATSSTIDRSTFVGPTH